MLNDDASRIQSEGRESQNPSKACGSENKPRGRKKRLSEEEKAESKRKHDRDSAKKAAEWRRTHPEEVRARDKRYREQSPSYHAEKQRRWRAMNHEHSKAYHREYMRRRTAEDINYRMRHSLASRITTAMFRTCNIKSEKTASLVGCDLPFLKAYVEARFVSGMSWANYGDWHLDHRIPCAKFDLSKTDQQAQCFHYTNLQPMWAADNLRKKDKVPADHQAEFL